VAIALALLGVLLFSIDAAAPGDRRPCPRRCWPWRRSRCSSSGAEVAITGVVLIALVSAAYDVVLRVADERFPFVRTVGLAIWTVLLACVLVHRFASLDGCRRHARRLARRSALRHRADPEAIKGFWIGFAPLFLLWIFAGRGRSSATPGGSRVAADRPARQADYGPGASVATGRLGIGVSLCAFVVVTMASGHCSATSSISRSAA
jgi:hypothetical protein